MKNSSEVCLTLEVLEDRMALSGAFGSAINAGPPSLTPFPFNGLMAQVTTLLQPHSGFRGAFTDSIQLSFVPVPSLQSQMQSFQSQIQSFQATQTAMIDQFVSEIGPILHLLQFNAL